jgi:hypothetical protein
MIESEKVFLKSKLAEAIELSDGYLCHWYGSQLQFIYQLEEQSKKDRQAFKDKLQRIWEECNERAEDKLLKFKFNIT